MVRHIRSMITSSIARSTPPIEMATLAPISISTKGLALNWEPWSVLNFCGMP